MAEVPAAGLVGTGWGSTVAAVHVIVLASRAEQYDLAESCFKIMSHLKTSSSSTIDDTFCQGASRAS